MTRFPFWLFASALCVVVVASCSGRETDDGVQTWTQDTGGSDTTRTLDSGEDTGMVQDQGATDGTQGEITGTGLTIQDLQDETRPNHPESGTDVVVSGVVTAVDTYAYEGDPANAGTFWIQDMAGGAYSGIEIYNQDNGIDVSGLIVGQTVSVSGQYVEFEGLSEIRMASFQVVTATENPLTPAVVQAAKVSTGQDEAERFEGVLVVVQDVSVTSNAVGYGKFEVTGGLEIGPELFDFGTMPAVGDSFDSITGVLTYHFDAVQLLPRSVADMVAGSGGGGDVDSLADLHESPPPGETTVEIAGLVVTAVVEDLDGYPAAFVQDPDDGNEGTMEYGIWLGARSYTTFTGISALADLAPGDEVTVAGPFKDSRYGGNLLEIRLASIEKTGSDQTFTIHDVADPTTIAEPGASTTEALEGSLVRLSSVTVSAVVADEFSLLVPVVVDDSGDPATALVLDVTRVYATVGEMPDTLTSGGTVTSVTGPLWYRRTGDIDAGTEGEQTWDAQRILVLDAADLNAD